MDVYIGLGSNLGRRTAWLRAGVDGLTGCGVSPVALSSVWESEPLGTAHPGWFLNMALHGRTILPPRNLLARMLELERRNDRIRQEPNAPRTLDLDLLMAGDLELDEPGLTLPHPRMWQRRFVLEPLAEIAPGLVNKGSGLNVVEECRRIRHTAEVRRLGELAPAEGALL